MKFKIDSEINASKINIAQIITNMHNQYIKNDAKNCDDGIILNQSCETMMAAECKNQATLVTGMNQYIELSSEMEMIEV